MLVVSDATPLNILVRIDHVDILARLFRLVVIPTAVAEELSRAATPPVVREWLAGHPSWLEIRAPSVKDDPTLPRHRGEREAIRLALELRADLLLVDERRPRQLARSLGIAVIRTVGILERAAVSGLIDLSSAFAKLKLTDFHVSQELLDGAMRRQEERMAKARTERGEAGSPNRDG